MAETEEVKEVKPEKSASLSRGRQYTWGTGRRKTAVARVRIADGTGAFKVNDRDLDAYFSEIQDRNAATNPLDLLNVRAKFDVFVNVDGGGHTGQAEAVKMGLARATMKLFPEKAHDLREAGCLTRDSRMKERKKYGRRGARRSFQFSKR